MGIQQIKELKASYYEYIAKVPQGLEIILANMQQQRLESAFQSIANLAEGIQALLIIEVALKQENLTINSGIHEILTSFDAINIALINKDSKQLEEIIQQQLVPTFKSSTEWVFQ